MEAKSIITAAVGRPAAERPRFHEISGIAWSGHGKISASMSLSMRAELAGSAAAGTGADAALTRFQVAVAVGRPACRDPEPRNDETDYVQPTLAELLAVRGDNYFYHNNAIWSLAHRRRR